MTEIAETLAFSFQFPFLRQALAAGVLVALCSSLLGVTLVLKRFSFIGDGLSHVAFGASAIAAAMNLTGDIFFVLPVTIVSAILLLRPGRNAKIRGDAALAVISVGALAIGYLAMSISSRSSGFAGDACDTLFGSTSIFTLSRTAVWLCAVLSVLAIAVFMLFYHKIFAVTFDEDFAAATGVGAARYNLFLAVVIAVIIVLAMNLVGALLVSALVVFPALSAMRVFKSFKAVTVCSVVLAAACAAGGILISIPAATPVGATVVAVNIAGFAAFSAAGVIAKRL
jgi:zinc transport system permease protein